MINHSVVASRSTGFGYVCRRCSRCCWHKNIQLNPYEAARLARAKGESTAQFRIAWTVDGRGTTLRQKDDGSCVFLGPEGCTVHADRPLVCRLYPLGRHVSADGSETYSILEGHPQSAGEFTNRGTIAEYLTAQGAMPFLWAADAYFKWVIYAQERLGLPPDAFGSEAGGEPEGVNLLDMDEVISAHCASSGEAERTDLYQRMRLHLQLLYEAIANVEVDDVKDDSKQEREKIGGARRFITDGAVARRL